jgi:glycosyltransferase involved in cell wall biosynthesis
MPAVSVVIPTSRGGAYLRETVESVQAQTIDDWEIVLVADGCDEDFSDLENDPRIRVVRQRNRGVSIARNIGVGLAQSDLVAFIDDDDRMLPDRLRAQVEVMADHDVGLCHTQVRIIDGDGNVTRAGQSRASTYAEYLEMDGATLISSSMIRKSTFLEIGGFNPLLRVGEDLELIIRFARESTIVFLPEVLIEYRYHANNTWTQTSPSSGKEVKVILSLNQLAALDHDETENLNSIRKGMKNVLPARAHLALLRADTALKEHEYPRAVKALGEALIYAPRASIRVAIRKIRRTRA